MTGKGELWHTKEEEEEEALLPPNLTSCLLYIRENKTRCYKKNLAFLFISKQLMLRI